jgi:hypothetical protein
MVVLHRGAGNGLGDQESVHGTSVPSLRWRTAAAISTDGHGGRVLS